MVSNQFLQLPLSPGDVVAVVAPAGPSNSDVEVDSALAAIERLGFNPSPGKNLRARKPYLAGNDEQRLDDLHWAFDSPEIKAIFALRGGYGSGRLLAKINWNPLFKNPKLLIGFSDITALHGAFQSFGLPSLHAPMPTSPAYQDLDQEILTRIYHLLTSRSMPPSFAGSFSLGKEDDAEGILVGGNLAVFQTLIGTRFMPDPTEKILFLEDVNESPYRLDRSLTHLSNCGYLQKLSGIVLGGFTGVKDDYLQEVWENCLSSLAIPVLGGISAGHVERNFPIPLGIPARIHTQEKQLAFSNSLFG